MYELYLYSPGKYYSAEPTFISRNEIPGQGFCSLYAVSEETAEALKQEGSTRFFKGAVWSPVLQIDVDNYVAAGSAERRLKAMGLGYKLYNSGGRGMHFVIERTHAPSHLLPLRDKSWVKKNIPEGDTSIYTHLHLFRNEGAVHEKTGNKKTLFSTHNGKALDLTNWAINWKEQSSNASFSSSSEKSVFECFRVMSEIVPRTGGERHYSLVRLCYALKDDAGVDSTTAAWWLSEVNKLYKEPKDGRELEKIISSIYTEQEEKD